MMKTFALIYLVLFSLVPSCKCAQKSTRLKDKAIQYLESVRHTKDTQSAVHFYHNLDWSIHEGLLSEKVKVVANRCQDSVLRELYLKALETLEDKNDGDSNCLLSNNKVNPTSKAPKDYILCAEKRNEQYDMISASITQTEDIDWTQTPVVDGTKHLASQWVIERIWAATGLIFKSWDTTLVFTLGMVICAVIT